MRTPEQQAAWELQCYGCTEAELKTALEQGAFFGGPAMVAMSMLSDAQEEIERGMKEQARQTINRAKYVIANAFMKERP